MDGKTRAGVALVPGPSGHGPSARRCRRRRPGLLLPGLWLLLLARPASCALGKHRGDPRAAAATLLSFIAIFKILLSPPILFYSPALPRPPFLRCFYILLGPSK